MVLVAYAGPARPAAALPDSVLCLPTDIHSLLVNKTSSSSSSSFLLLLVVAVQLPKHASMQPRARTPVGTYTYLITYPHIHTQCMTRARTPTHPHTHTHMGARTHTQSITPPITTGHPEYFRLVRKSKP